MKETAAAKFERQHMDSPDLHHHHHHGTLVPRGSMADIGSEFELRRQACGRTRAPPPPPLRSGC